MQMNSTDKHAEVGNGWTDMATRDRNKLTHTHHSETEMLKASNFRCQQLFFQQLAHTNPHLPFIIGEVVSVMP